MTRKKATPKKKSSSKKAATRKRPASKKTTSKKKTSKRKVTRKKASPTSEKKTARKATKKKVSTKKTTARKAVPTPEPKPEPKKKPKYLVGKSKEFRSLLENLRRQIDEQISFLSSDSLNKEKYDVPRDSGTDDFDRDFALSLLSSGQDALFEIGEALRRITERKYGACECCADRISVKRLKAIPFARLCIQCQEAAEKNRPRYHAIGTTLPGGSQRMSNISSGS